MIVARVAAARTAASRAETGASMRSSSVLTSSSRASSASGSRAHASATPGRPPEILASRAASGASAASSSTSRASMSRGPTGPRRIRAQRDRMVGSSGSSASAQRIRITPAGGSSRVLSRAAWASSLRRCAPSMIATRAPPSTGRSASSVTRSRMPRCFEPGPPITTWRPGPSGASRCTSGCPPDATSRHDRHAPHGRADGGSAVQSSPAARSPASVVLPMPAGPTNSTAWGIRPWIMVPTAASATG